jgi:hypothetical protein
MTNPFAAELDENFAALVISVLLFGYVRES